MVAAAKDLYPQIAAPFGLIAAHEVTELDLWNTGGFCKNFDDDLSYEDDVQEDDLIQDGTALVEFVAGKYPVICQLQPLHEECSALVDNTGRCIDAGTHRLQDDLNLEIHTLATTGGFYRVCEVDDFDDLDECDDIDDQTNPYPPLPAAQAVQCLVPHVTLSPFDLSPLDEIAQRATVQIAPAIVSNGPRSPSPLAQLAFSDVSGGDEIGIPESGDPSPHSSPAFSVCPSLTSSPSLSFAEVFDEDLGLATPIGVDHFRFEDVRIHDDLEGTRFYDISLGDLNPDSVPNPDPIRLLDEPAKRGFYRVSGRHLDYEQATAESEVSGSMEHLSFMAEVKAWMGRIPFRKRGSLDTRLGSI